MYSAIPLRIKKGARKKAWQNILMLSINIMLEKEIYHLDKGLPDREKTIFKGAAKHFKFSLNDKINAEVRCIENDTDDIVLRVELFEKNDAIQEIKRKMDKKPILSAEGVFQKNQSKGLKTNGASFNGPRDLTKMLADMDVILNGYKKTISD